MFVDLADEVADIRSLIEDNLGQLSREVGEPLSFEADDSPTWTIRLGGEVGRLRRDSASGDVLLEGPDLDSMFDAFSLLRDLHDNPDTDLIVRDCESVEEAVGRVEKAIAGTWPSHQLHGVDWPALCEEWRPRVVESDDPILEMRRWVARLGDAHTAVRPSETPGRLPYLARRDGGSIVLVDVPVGTAGHQAGARPGDVLVGIDAAAIGDTIIGRPHSHDAIVGMSALRGVVGEEALLATARGASWHETYQMSAWPHPVESVRLPTGAHYIRLRVWLPDLEEALDHALDEAGDARSVVFDLRGNGGGNYLMACRARGRFLAAARQVGWIRYTDPGGALTDWEPINAEAAGPGRRITQPTMVLIDPETYSASEDFLMGLADEPNISVRGVPSGGGSGRLRSVRLLPGWQLTVTTCHTATMDMHVIEGSGHPVVGPVTADLLPPGAV